MVKVGDWIFQVLWKWQMRDETRTFANWLRRMSSERPPANVKKRTKCGRLIVRSPSGPLVAPLGSSAILPCYVDELLSMEGLKVEWRRTDSETLVHLYQDGESRAEAQQQDYHDRAHFFTDQIQHGNFSLRLDNLRAEDEGKYTCRVYSQQTSGETVVQLNLSNVGFSVSHIMVLILCISASGSALMLGSMIYCRSHNTNTDTAFHLQMFLVFCPNILMFLAFVLWGVFVGSQNETISCCALYCVRPLMLLWAAPYVNEFTGNIKKWILNYSYRTEYVVVSAVVYSVLFEFAWAKSLNNADFDHDVVTCLFVIVLLFNLIYIIYLLARFIDTSSERTFIITFGVLAGIILDLQPSLQFILLFYAFGSVRGGFYIVTVLPVFLTMTNYDWTAVCKKKMECSPLVMRSVWIILMLLANAIMVYFYIMALENEKDRIGWTCLFGFLQLLWILINFTWAFGDYGLHRVVSVYVFGSVGVVLLNSVTLMTELILKTVNGDHAVGDLRVVVFPSESFFILPLLIFRVFNPSRQNTAESIESSAN